MKNVLITFLLVTQPALAATTEVRFLGGEQSFEIHYDQKHFDIHDKVGPRSLTIRSCNRQIVDKFTRELVKKISQVLRVHVGKTLPKTQAATLRFENVDMPILEMDPSLKYFRKVAFNTNILSMESMRACEKK